MKVQVRRLSPHQNAKVFAVMMALSSLIFLVPMAIIMALLPGEAQEGQPPLILFILFPLIYLVMGYIMMVIGALLYNVVVKYIGGFEYESSESRAA